MCSTPLAQSWGNLKHPSCLTEWAGIWRLEPWGYGWLTGVCGSLAVTHFCCMLLPPFLGSPPSSYHS